MAEASPPHDAASAWTWRQLNDEVDRRASVSLEVIDKRSWASQARAPPLGSARLSSVGSTLSVASAKVTESAFPFCSPKRLEK
jgi:hypothetical protein